MPDDVRAAPPFWHYRLFGLSIRSSIELPELPVVEAAGPADVTIDRGIVTGPDFEAQPTVATVDGGGVVLAVPEVGRFCVRRGRCVTVAPEPDASDINVRLFLLGSAMGLVLHQRGILPLHANAVELGEEAVAFLGHSGAGKSTLAAAFHDAGHRVLSDDVCAITPRANRFVVEPGIPRLRLWRDALERSGRAVADHPRAFDALDKYTVATDHALRGVARPLRAIYLLARHDTPDDGLSIDRLTGIVAVRALVENTYRGGYIAQVGDPAAHMRACAALATAVPIYRLRRPWSAEAVGASVAALARHALA